MTNLLPPWRVNQRHHSISQLSSFRLTIGPKYVTLNEIFKIYRNFVHALIKSFENVKFKLSKRISMHKHDLKPKFAKLN